jgi:hypothetical protein
MNRRDYLMGSLSAGLALLSTRSAHADNDWAIEALAQTVGARKDSSLA